MPHEALPNSPEKKEVHDDNARKFFTTGLPPEFVEGFGATSFSLITDWLETSGENEKKLAYKKFENDDVQILLITKVIKKDGNRIAEKEKITQEQYEEFLGSSILRVEKKRYEFTYAQGDVLFSMKYDEFAKSSLRVLEVDATSEDERETFDPSEFTSELVEVTGDMRYYGYRVANAL